MPVTQIASNRASYRNRLKAARDTAGISQNKLEEISGVSKPVIWKVETANHWPEEGVRNRLAEALNVDPGWLFYIEGPAGAAKKR